MHRVEYTLAELTDLYARIKNLPSYTPGSYIQHSAAHLISEIMRDVGGSAVSGTATGITYSYLADWVSPPDLYLADRVSPPDLKYLTPGGPESIYKVIRYQVTSKKHPQVQHAYQVLYHTPFTHLPLLIGHKEKLIRIIVQWRLEINK